MRSFLGKLSLLFALPIACSTSCTFRGNDALALVDIKLEKSSVRTLDFKVDYPQDIVFAATGDVFVLDGESKVTKVSPDGTATVAHREMRSAFGLAIDSDGDVFASQLEPGRIYGIGNRTTGRTIDLPEGVHPWGLTIASNGDIVFAEPRNNRIGRVSKDGAYSVLAGPTQIAAQGKNPGSSGVGEGLADGAPAEARFRRPLDVAAAVDGSIYVADSGNGAIRKIEQGGNVLTIYTFMAEDKGKDDLGYPAGIAVNPLGGLAVTTGEGNKVLSIDMTGGRLLAVGSGAMCSKFCAMNCLPNQDTECFSDGSGSQSRFFNPRGIFVANNGVAFVADSENNKIRQIQL